MKSRLLQALAHAPPPLRRRAYLRSLGFDSAEVARLQFKLAETLEERIQSFRVLHDMYVRRGLIDPTPTGLRFTVFSVLPTTAIFVGIRDGKVVSTMSLIEDSPLGVPMEKLYREEIGRRRLERRRFAEVSALAVQTEARGKGLALMMYNLMFRWAFFHRSVDELVIAVHPKAEGFYRDVLLFDRLGDLRAYESLKDAPAVALNLDLQTFVRRSRALYNRPRRPGETVPVQNLYHFFCEARFPNLSMPTLRADMSRRLPPPAWSHEDVSRLFEEHGFDIASLTSEERRFFILEYPNMDWSIPRARGFRRSVSGLREGGRTGSPAADALLGAAAHAPSHDNTQPWRFTADTKTGRIAFHVDEGRDASPLNAGQRLSRLAVGCAIENFHRTARLNGWSVAVEDPPATAVAMFRVTDESLAPPRVDGAIFARTTNRRLYGKRPVPPAVLERLASKTPDLDGTKTHWILERPRIEVLADLAGRAERIVFAHGESRRARQARVRFDREREDAVSDGLPLGSLELSRTRERLLRLAARLPNRVVKALGLPVLEGSRAANLVRSASGLCLVVAPDASLASDLAAGRAAARAWLALTDEGLAAQPLLALIGLDAIPEHGAPKLVASFSSAELSAPRSNLRTWAPEIGPGSPAFLLRFGDAPPPTARSGRQPLEAVTRQAPLEPPRQPVSTPTPAPVRKSRRARVLFVGEAISFSHASRPFALACGITPDLFEAVFACDTRFRHLFPPVDFEIVPLRSIPSEQFLDALAAGSPLYDIKTLEEYVEEDLRLLREVTPDIVLGDFRLSLGVSARIRGIPYVNLAETCWSPYAKLKIPLGENPVARLIGPRAAYAIFNLVRTVALAYHALPMNAVRRSHGLQALRPDLRRVFTDGDYVLYFDVPELTPMYRLPANHQYLGPVLWSPAVPLPPWWSEMPRHLPVVFVTLGSFTPPAALPVILDALAPLPVTVVAETRGARVQPVPKNAFVADFLPRDRMIKEARLVVCGGSTSSSHQALAQGRPVLGIVTNMSEHLNMQAIEQAGAGCFVRAGSLDPETLGDLIQSLLVRASSTEAAEGLASTFRRYDAATRLQDFLARIPVHTSSSML